MTVHVSSKFVVYEYRFVTLAFMVYETWKWLIHCPSLIQNHSGVDNAALGIVSPPSHTHSPWNRGPRPVPLRRQLSDQYHYGDNSPTSTSAETTLRPIPLRRHLPDQYLYGDHSPTSTYTETTSRPVTLRRQLPDQYLYGDNSSTSTSTETTPRPVPLRRQLPDQHLYGDNSVRNKS